MTTQMTNGSEVVLTTGAAVEDLLHNAYTADDTASKWVVAC